jgi:hypothetical protein
MAGNAMRALAMDRVKMDIVNVLRIGIPMGWNSAL